MRFNALLISLLNVYVANLLASVAITYFKGTSHDLKICLVASGSLT